MKNKDMGHPKLIIGGIAHHNEVEEFYSELEKDEHEKKFDSYIITYIDFLGVKEKMKRSNSYESLQITRFLLSGTKRTANYISDVNEIDDFEIKIFSDNVVIAQKVHEEKLADQIISMVNLIGQIQFHALMQFDFWLRGGVTIGELYIDNSVVWGMGLIEAYYMENSLANYPRVIISKKILSMYEELNTKSFNLSALLKQDIDGLYFIDFLLAAPNIKLIPTISEILSEKREASVNEPDRVKQKVNWLINHFNEQCRRLKDRGDYERYILPFI